MNKERAKELFEKFEKHMEKFCEENNVVFKVDKKFFSSVDMGGSLVIAPRGEGNLSMEELDYRKHCYSYGCGTDDYLKKFTVQGEVYELIGFSPRARKYPVLARKVGTDNIYKMPLSVLSTN